MFDGNRAQLSLLFFVISGTVSVFECQPSSGGSAGSSSTINNGTVDLSNHVISGYINNQFQSQASSLNSAFGTNAHLSGSSSANADSGTSSFDLDSADIVANSGANSNGNGGTGSVSNLDQSNSSTVNGLAVIGQSQITGTGTTLNLNSNANANANAYAQESKINDSGKDKGHHFHVHLTREGQGALYHRQKSRNANQVGKTMQSKNPSHRLRNSDGSTSGELTIKSNTVVRKRQEQGML